MRAVAAMGPLLGLLLVAPARAGAHPAQPSEAQVDDAVCEDSRRAGIWNLGWATVFGVSAVGSASYAALAPRSWLDDDERAALYVTTAKASIGLLAKIIDPLQLDMEGLCRDPPAASLPKRRALLAEIVRRERRALIPNIVGGLLLNTGGLLYLGFGRGAWESAWISFGVGSAVGVASTVTAPLHSWLLRRRVGDSRTVALPLFAPHVVGLALAGSW